MLNGEDEYTERQWQWELLKIILLLYPKYIHVIPEAHVRDVYANKNRSIDYLLVDADGTSLSFSEGMIKISDAQSVTLYLTAATDYLNEYPNYQGRDYEQLNKETIAGVKAMSYKRMKKEHIADYQSLFNRVSFHLEGEEQTCWARGFGHHAKRRLEASSRSSTCHIWPDGHSSLGQQQSSD